ncbi:MAG: UvrD-helicase domain-containing protein [Ilumatobacteraceae bacterium]
MNGELDLRGPLPSGRLVIEASAGTGKTYSLSALVVRHVAERRRAAADLLLVTFTRAAAAELRDRCRGALVAAERVLATGVVPDQFSWMDVLLDADDDELVERHRALIDAVRTFDDATIATIHGYCQTALAQLGLRSGAAVDTELSNHQAWYVEEVCRDLVLEELFRDAQALSWPADTVPGPERVLEALKASVSAVLGNRGVRIVPDATCTAAPTDRPGRLGRWVELVDRAVELVGERQRARQEMGYDELVNGLHDAVHHPVTGADAVATLRSRHQLVLVDEFQDTDAVQWATFERIFSGGDLVTVGDPKQAIYRFRGADVHAYLRAVDGAEARRLGTNRRSDPSLVAATNRLLSGVRLGDARIEVSEVASPDHAADALDGAPLRIRRVPVHPSVCGARGDVQSGLTERAIVDDVVRVAVQMLDDEAITVGGVARSMTPGDVAVLVRNNDQAQRVVQALVEAGVPAVRARTGSVLTSEAVDDLSSLLAALEQPSRGGLVRNLGLGVFVGIPAAELDPDPGDPQVAARNEERFAALQRRCARWADLLTRVPFLAWYDAVRAESGLAARVLRHPMGERRLTDLDHLAELLGGELGGTRTTAASARRALARLVTSADDTDTGPQMRRIDSDARAVQVSTMHGSKGLEYPVVLVPFAWKDCMTRAPFEYHTADGARTIDVASNQRWTGATPDESPECREHLAKVGDLGDDLRLLYVALTRAKHRSVVWWAPYEKGGAWGLSKVLFDRDEAGEPAHTEPTLTLDGTTVTTTFPSHLPPDPSGVDAAFDRLVARGRDAGGRTLIAVEEVPLDDPRARWVEPPPADEPPLLRTADLRGRDRLADPAWRRWSFTGITKDRHDVWVPAMPVTGGTDETDAGDAASPAPASPSMPWAALGGGTAFGTLVHEVLEHVDPTSPTLEDDLERLVAARTVGTTFAPVADVVTGLAAAIRTPLGPIADDRPLAGIAVVDRLAELDFDMPLSAAQVIGAPRIGDVLLATLPAGDPQREYAQQLADGRFGTDLKGYLAGSIDAVLRLRGDDGDRFVVVDYKTNRLHRRDAAHPLEAYHPDVLPDAMADADYPLQSILYSVALHRLLRWRLGARYRPDQHLGGIAYLFLRGMVGPDTPTTADGRRHGVFDWRPPAATVIALDHLLATGGME